MVVKRQNTSYMIGQVYDALKRAVDAYLHFICDRSDLVLVKLTNIRLEGEMAHSYKMGHPDIYHEALFTVYVSYSLQLCDKTLTVQDHGLPTNFYAQFIPDKVIDPDSVHSYGTKTSIVDYTVHFAAKFLLQKLRELLTQLNDDLWPIYMKNYLQVFIMSKHYMEHNTKGHDFLLQSKELVDIVYSLVPLAYDSVDHIDTVIHMMEQLYKIRNAYPKLYRKYLANIEEKLKNAIFVYFAQKRVGEPVEEHMIALIDKYNQCFGERITIYKQDKGCVISREGGFVCFQNKQGRLVRTTNNAKLAKSFEEHRRKVGIE